MQLTANSDIEFVEGDEEDEDEEGDDDEDQESYDGGCDSLHFFFELYLLLSYFHLSRIQFWKDLMELETHAWKRRIDRSAQKKEKMKMRRMKNV